MLANEEGVVTCAPQALHIGGGVNSALGHADGTRGNSFGQPHRDVQIDREGVQIAVIHTDNFRAGVDSRIQLVLIVHLNQSGHAILSGTLAEAAQLGCGQNSRNQQDRIGAMGGRFDDVIFVNRKVLAQYWKADRFASLLEVGEASLEVFCLGEHGQSRGAPLRIQPADGCGVEGVREDAFTR